jgi:hypothetical protein
VKVVLLRLAYFRKLLSNEQMLANTLAEKGYLSNNLVFVKK